MLANLLQLMSKNRSLVYSFMWKRLCGSDIFMCVYGWTHLLFVSFLCWLLQAIEMLKCLRKYASMPFKKEQHVEARNPSRIGVKTFSLQHL